MSQILIVDHLQLFAQGLKSLIDAQPDLSVPAIALNGQDALAHAQKHRPDLILMGLSLPDIPGIQVTHQILKKRPRLKILALSRQAHPQLVQAMLKAGARGFVLKTSPFHQLAAGIQAVLAGGIFFSPELSPALINQNQPLNRLSPRQIQILKRIAQGQIPKAIAADLNLSLKTVQYHRRQIMAHLKAETDADLTRLAIQQNLVTL